MEREKYFYRIFVTRSLKMSQFGSKRFGKGKNTEGIHKKFDGGNIHVGCEHLRINLVIEKRGKKSAWARS